MACRIFLDQRLNLCPLHGWEDSYPLWCQGSPRDLILRWSWGSEWTVTHLRSSCPLVVESRLKPNPLTSSYGLSILIHTTSWASLVAQMVKNLPVMQETWAQSLGWEDPLEEGMATHSSILAWRIPSTEEPGGLQVHGVAMCGTQLSN